jgi:hypothetical protein
MQSSQENLQDMVTSIPDPGNTSKMKTIYTKMLYRLLKLEATLDEVNLKVNLPCHCESIDKQRLMIKVMLCSSVISFFMTAWTCAILGIVRPN